MTRIPQHQHDQDLRGAPARRRKPLQRRGSFLVTVVGILALLAVLTVVYVSIGRSDTQSSAAFAQSANRDSVPRQMMDYIAQIIADDVGDTYDPTTPRTGAVRALVPPAILHETWDTPSSALEVSFVNPSNDRIETRRVTVGRTGSNYALFTPTGEVIVSVAGGNEIRVGTGTDPWLRSTEPTVLDFALDWGAAIEYPVRRRDWGNLSNVAPDGAFVNLFNLRDNFRATPIEMRENMWMLESSDPTLPDSDSRRTTQTDYGLDAPTTGLRQVLDTAPAAFGARQRDVFQRAGDPDFRTTPNVASRDDYLPYLFADADGDGNADARWIELKEARSDDPASWRDLLKVPDEKLRWFFAVSIVDLSSMVNLNTATDGTVTPDEERPLGGSPSLVDVRRLLSLYDPVLDGDLQLSRADAYMSGAYAGYDPTTGVEAGDRAYDALRYSMISSQGIPALQANPGFAGLDFVTLGNYDLEFGNAANPLFAGLPYTIHNEPQASAYFDYVGSRLAGVGFDRDRNTYLRGPGFGIESEAELLTFFGINDDRIKSPAEAVLERRGDPSGIGGASTALVSPLRSDLSTADERADWYDGDGRRQDEFYLQNLLDLRRRVTTLSGSRRFVARPTGVLSGEDPSTGDRELTAGDLATPINEDMFDQGTALSDPRSGDSRLAMYLDALVPLDPLFAWDPTPQFWTASYGHRGPELATRIAAALTVNLLDAADRDDRPTRRTLVLTGDSIDPNAGPIPLQFSGGTVQRGNAADALAPWPIMYPGEGRVADPSVATFQDSPVLNVFGIEAQPFITEVGFATVYTDTPLAEGGNMDWELITIVLPDGTTQSVANPAVPPDIDGTVDLSNPDFLFEAVAFQIHNPFAQRVDLSSNGEAVYYVQFGNRYFKLADLEYDYPSNSFSGNETQLSLAPAGTNGDTITFYALSQDVDDIALRLGSRSVLGAASPQVTADNLLNEWAEEQFGDGTKVPVHRVYPFDPETSDPTDPATYAPFLDLHDDTGGDPINRKVIKLWRVEKPALEYGYPVNTANAEAANLNDLSTDVLVDRIRQQSVAAEAAVYLDRRLPAEDVRVGGARAGDETDPGDHDNHGLTITRYATIRRLDDPDQGRFAMRTWRNVLPSYCIEVKNPDTIAGGHANAQLDDGSPIDSLRKVDFTRGNAYNAELTLEEWWAEQNDDGDPATIDTLTEAPYDKSGETIGPNRNGASFDQTLESYITRPVFQLNNDDFENTDEELIFRPADILLPLGICPTHSPGADLNDVVDDEWTTLAEAMALATAYENTSAAGADRTSQVYIDAFINTYAIDPNVWLPVLDGGSLFYDAYVPYVDADGPDRQFTPDSDDMRIGIGMTPAMRLLETLTGLSESQVAIDRLIPGQININSASPEVLRTLPMLSPAPGQDPITGDDLYWWLNGDQHDGESDIAGAVAAWRDRSSVFLRTPTGASAGAADKVNFLGDNPPTQYPPGESPEDFGRFAATGIAGVDERVGFRSIGELMGVRDLDIASWNGGLRTNPHNMDRLFFDGKDIEQTGLVRTIDDGASNMVSEGYPDDPAEAYALINPVLDSVTTRSDVFAVWFLMHGYQESDTTGLADDQALTPSVARRFLAIVDRSNVTQPGQSPRVLYFREVPVRAGF